MSEKKWYTEEADGATTGPFSFEELSGLVEKGEIDAETLVGMQGQAKRPFSEVEKLTAQNIDYPSPIPREKDAAHRLHRQKRGENTPRPWRRFLARMFDYTLYGFVLGILFALFDISLAPQYWGIIGIGLIFLWTFIEAGFLSACGKTPGKALLRLKVLKKDGTNLSYLDAINRSFSVWWLGLGAAIYPISIVTMIVACTKLSNLGETTWDVKGGYEVKGKKIGVLRILVTILFFVILLGLASGGNSN